MTTAPAMIVASGRFNGQRLSYWVNPGEETTMHVTKALSVRTRSVEQEVKGTRQDLEVYDHRYYRMTVEGELRANNHRKEAIKLVVRRRFSGELLSADGEPKSTLLEEGVYSVNKRNQLTWNATLKPGEELKLVYPLHRTRMALSGVTRSLVPRVACGGRRCRSGWSSRARACRRCRGPWFGPGASPTPRASSV